MIYGIIGLAIMLSVYGIINFIFGTFQGLGPGINGPIQSPQTLNSLEGK